MFSPAVAEATGPAAGTRSRRRQRPKSTDSLVQQPKAKRQRVPLSEQTFVNPDVRPEMTEVKPDRPVAATPEIKNDGIENMVVPRKELGLRAKKPRASERVSKGDGSAVLSTNSAYTVSKLPALPDRLRVDATVPQHGDIFSSSGHAITLTHTHAIVWPYTSMTTSPETFTFALPYPSKNATDPLPLASLVSPSASSTEPGLVVVMPVSGRITFWETISCAATIDLMRQQRHGVEHTIYGMSSGERVVQITPAESAGYILAMSSGRLAHMMVRDSHGRPSISVQFLSTSLGVSHVGIFGSIRHVLSHSTGRGEIAAVRSEPTSQVGERNVVAATAKGKLVAWKFHRGGRYDTLAEVDVRDSVIDAIRDADQAAAEFPADSFELLDFTYVPKGLESKYHEMSRLTDAAEPTDSTVQHLVLLVSLTKRFNSRYVLVEAVIAPGATKIGMVRPISCYTTPVSSKSSSDSIRPRIHLPRPALVAFVVFDRAAVIASIAIPPLSPDSQLQEDAHLAPDVFEDVIDLRDDDALEIVGSGFEEPSAPSAHEDSRSHRYKAKNPTAVLMVRGVGILRLATTDIDRFGSDTAPKVTAKSKLEQAVFYSVKTDNPLLFDGRRDAKLFTHEEMSAAALELSHEILGSTNPHVSTLPVSLEDNLKSRSLALERLIRYLAATHVRIDRRTRWTLLWNAEKMAVSSALWKKQEIFTAQRPAEEKKTLITEIVEYIHEDQKSNPDVSAGQVDRVRHWFINDISRLELFVAWAYQVIKHMYKGQTLDDFKLSHLMQEAVTINVVALTGGLNFREKNIELYGLKDEALEHGVLEDYTDLPEPWTGSHWVSNNSKRLLELCNQWIQQYYPPRKDHPSSRRPSAAVITSIVNKMAALTDHCLLSILEQSRWASITNDAKQLQWAHACSEAYLTSRHDKILALEALELWTDAMAIAEKHKSWSALADVLITHVKGLGERSLDPSLSVAAVDKLLDEVDALKEKLKSYFAKYGQDFAFAAYDVMLAKDGVAGVLDYPGDDHGFKTKYLRSKPELAKISWINDVQQEKDISHAAGTLLDLGLWREQQAWSKKIELSLGKLALLASEDDVPSEPTRASSERSGKQLDQINKELEVIRVQDMVFSEILQTVSTALDEAAELELAMEAHAPDVPKKHKVLQQVVENGMRLLLKHEALDPLTLIDILTLANLGDSYTGNHRFFLALTVAHNGLRGQEYKAARRLIWRRCYIADDWATINDTQRRGDMEVAELIGNAVLFRTSVANFGHYQDLEEHFKPLAPSDCLGVYTDEPDRRFKDMDKAFREKLVEAMKWEDSQLKKNIDKYRLEEWASTTDAEARLAVNGVVDNAIAESLAIVGGGVEENGSA
ncbi:related to NUP133 Nuclear pore protein [Cephalotrichum gorgonifer]|uniref:Related to NUP133 Nuclear pore protein n=1 Tax=Cephalotrichum gorgonifer TaxID=2041049 RepID=A0AAE8MRS2_9PEZI|nr:related to NUP133 Nuclear pore protein [Cephalotrichum gorgonifer]